MKDLSLKEQFPSLVAARYLRRIAGASLRLIGHGLPVCLQKTGVYSRRIKCGLTTISTAHAITVTYSLDWSLGAYSLPELVSRL